MSFYYALNTLNRLDRDAEPYLSNQVAPEALNGFMLRDDIPPSFIEKFEQDGVGFIRSDYSRTPLVQAYNPDYVVPYNSSEMLADPSTYDFNENTNEASKDQVGGLLMGLRFVEHFIPPNVVVQPTASDTPMNLESEAKAIAERMMSHIRGNGYNLLRPRTDGQLAVVHRGSHLGFGAYYYEDILSDMGGLCVYRRPHCDGLCSFGNCTSNAGWRI